jgi:hypothetical protein
VLESFPVLFRTTLDVNTESNPNGNGGAMNAKPSSQTTISVHINAQKYLLMPSEDLM